MHNLITQLNRLVFKQTEPVLPASGFQFIKNRKNFVSALTESVKKRTAIGIYSPVFGEGMFVTGVDDIYTSDDEEIIVFKRYDITGAILQRNILSVSEISAICKFDVRYKNPVLH